MQAVVTVRTPESSSCPSPLHHRGCEDEVSGKSATQMLMTLLFLQSYLPVWLTSTVNVRLKRVHLCWETGNGASPQSGASGVGVVCTLLALLW